MNKRNLFSASCAHAVLSILFLALFLLTPQAQAQDGKTTTTTTATAPVAANDQKAEQIVERAIKALGGDSYLNVRSAASRGYYTQFKEGVSGLPLTFVDYIVYPDRERTEFKGAGTRVIQTNTGDTGWLYDGQAKTLQDMTREQVEDFRNAMRTNIDYLLHGFWRKEGAKLTYVGRREAGLAKRNETIRLTYADGLAVEFEFGAQDALPAKVLYKKKDKEGAESAEEDRFAQFVTIDGVMVPFIVDHFRNGAQSSRINYQSIELNRTVADSLFTRPANAKAVK
jgi:outer membrane lipoprotein-sorting protein